MIHLVQNASHIKMSYFKAIKFWYIAGATETTSRPRIEGSIWSWIYRDIVAL